MPTNACVDPVTDPNIFNFPGILYFLCCSHEFPRNYYSDIHELPFRSALTIGTNSGKITRIFTICFMYGKKQYRYASLVLRGQQKKHELKPDR